MNEQQQQRCLKLKGDKSNTLRGKLLVLLRSQTSLRRPIHSHVGTFKLAKLKRRLEGQACVCVSVVLNLNFWKFFRQNLKEMTDTMDVSTTGDDEVSQLSYEERASRATIISKPMASKKLAKKLTKLIKKAHKQKDFLRSGLKLVQSKIKKGERGLVVIAGSVTPIDVVCHMPAVCENNDIPYVFIPTGKELGMAMGVKRCTLIVLIRRNDDYGKLYDECFEEVKHLPPVQPLDIGSS